MKLHSTRGYRVINNWLKAKGLKPFAFQEQTWQHISVGHSGLVNAPTGTGKTFSVFLGALIQFINEHPQQYAKKGKNGLQLLWITPLRALAKDIGRAMEEVIRELGMQWKVGIRNGDTSLSDRQKQKRQMPEVLIITPESLHLLLAQKGYPEVFSSLRIVAADEWHELMSSKRGVQVELALSRICALKGKEVKSKFKIPPVSDRSTDHSPQSTDTVETSAIYDCHRSSVNCHLLSTANFSLWGISATIGNLQQAMEVLLAPLQ